MVASICERRVGQNKVMSITYNRFYNEALSITLIFNWYNSVVKVNFNSIIINSQEVISFYMQGRVNLLNWKNIFNSLVYVLE